MDFSTLEVAELAAVQGGLLTSIYLADHAGASLKSKQLHLGALIDRAAECLRQEGLDSTAIATALAPAREVAQADLWEHWSAGLALFCDGEGGVRWFHLPEPPREAVVTGRRFHLRPLVPLLRTLRPFHVLALSQASVRLVEWNGAQAREIRPAKMPASLEEALGGELEPVYVEMHSAVHHHGGKGDVVYHGGGSASEGTKGELPRFLQRVDAAVVAAAPVRDTPLVLAGVGYLVATYRHLSRHPHLVAGSVGGNQDLVSVEELVRRAADCMREMLMAAERHTASRFDELAGSARTLTELGPVLDAAREGRVESLFVSADSEVSGHARNGARTAVHAVRQPDDEELLDLATALTLAQRGQIHVLTPTEVPGGGAVAAILRY